MRVSTNQFYQRALSSMQSQQGSLQEIQLQIASGLRIMKPSDDPSGAVKVLNLNTNLGLVDQYNRNANLATAALSHEETVLESANNSLQRIRELTVQANNPVYQDSARHDISLEIEERLKELLALANTRDQNGEYIFAGNRSGEIPFTKSGSDFNYQGDSGERQVQIGEGAKVTMRDAGDAVFMNVPGGNGRIQVSAGAANTGTLLPGQYSTTGSYVRDTYTVAFSLNGTGQLQYEVSDSAVPTPNVVDTGLYASGQSLAFAGVNLALTGTAQPGDTIKVEPSAPQNMFAMVQDIARALATPASSAADRVKIQGAMAKGLANLDQALDVINTHRASVGARLNNIETVQDINEDFRLQLETVKSETRDLDFAEALTRFNQKLTSLEAAQQAFIKTSQLSLFNYL